MLKYIMTTACPRECSYCISRNLVGIEETNNIEAIIATFKRLRYDGHSNIMLTGGEPSEHPCFELILGAALSIFSGVHITTINLNMISYPIGEYFSSIVFSLHDVNTPINGISVSVPVYAAVMADKYHSELPFKLRKKGFSGLTICEDQRSSMRFESVFSLPNLGDFSYKINRTVACLDETFIFPDLSIYTDFREWL